MKTYEAHTYRNGVCRVEYSVKAKNALVANSKLLKMLRGRSFYLYDASENKSIGDNELYDQQ